MGYGAVDDTVGNGLGWAVDCYGGYGPVYGTVSNGLLAVMWDSCCFPRSYGFQHIGSHFIMVFICSGVFYEGSLDQFFLVINMKIGVVIDMDEK